MRYSVLAVMCALAWGATAQQALAQAEVTAWGNVEGIRLEGQVMPFETSLCTLGPNGTEIDRTGKERQRPQFSRSGDRRTVTTRLGALSITEVVEDTGPGTATLNVRFAADSVATPAGGYLCLDLPREEYGGGRIEPIGATSGASIALPEPVTLGSGELARVTARGVRIVGPRRQIEIGFDAPTEVIVHNDRRNGDDDYRVYLPVMPGRSTKGRRADRTFTFKVAGEIDRTPVTLALDTSRPGRAFDGLGGNFRIQNPRLDPMVIQYSLENLRVAWGRVEMPWRLWHPEEDMDPAAVAPDQLNERVRQSMEMARTLAQKDIPVVIGVWFPPQWAAIGPLPNARPEGGPRGNALNPEKMPQIYESIASYIRYLKRHYGVEPVLFSFNESDLGIDVRQTAEEHAAFNKGLGMYLASQGLATRMVLGDVSDATPTEFIRPSMEDPSVWPYIGAVSYHSWRGWSDELLTFWGDAAKKLNVPLLVGEGSTDAGAWRYPTIFQEPKFALEEINLYTRMLALSEPKSILQWQLTADYSILAGGGLFGDTTALRPTQRFWNLKQLASSPEGAFHLPVTCAHPDVSCAALGDIANGAYAVHVVNNGAARTATVTGLPTGLRELRVWVTDHRRGMEEGQRVPVAGGKAELTLDAASFTTVLGIQ